MQAGLQDLGGKLENLSANINTDFEIRRSIAKQSVKVVMLVGEWEWELDWGQWSTLWALGHRHYVMKEPAGLGRGIDEWPPEKKIRQDLMRCQG